MKEFFLVILCIFFRFLPNFVSGTGYENIARVLGVDLSFVSLCYLTFCLIDRERIALKSAVSYLLTIVFIASLCNLFIITTGENIIFRMIFSILLSFLSFIGIPAVIMKSPIKSGYSENSDIIHLVLRKPDSVLMSLFSSLLVQCDSCSIVINEKWYRFTKKDRKLEILDATKIDSKKYIIVPTKFKKGYRPIKVGSSYSLFKNNCCTAFWGLFEIKFNIFHSIPSSFSYRILK